MSSNAPRVLIHPDQDELVASVARRFIRKSVQIIDDFGEVTVCLTGGTAGIASLAAINASPERDRIAWDRMNVWWGDERWVPRDDPERNERQARQALLDHVPLDPDRVHPMPASDEGLDLDAAAVRYAAELRAAALPNQALPAIDMVYLGVGPDGHINSMFPGMAAIRERTELVLPVRNSPKPPPERITLTLPVVNSAARVVVLFAGAEKGVPLGLALAGANIDEVPVAGVLGRRKTIFHVDAEAAAQVPAGLIERERYWTAEDDER